MKKLVADKGYDSEKIHCSCYERGMISIIPSSRGFYRRKMQRYNKPSVDHRRETVECVIGVVKRRCGSSVRYRKARSIRAELDFRAITHNLKVAVKRTFSSRPA